MSKAAIRHCSNKDGLIVCLAPDICLTPVGASLVPIPYMIVSKLSWSQNTDSKVSFGDQPAFTMVSRTVKVTGNEAGASGGVKSGINQGWCRPKSNKASFLIAGQAVIQHDNTYEMNCNGPDGPGNTLGKVRFVE